MTMRTITIVVEGGCVIEVKNLPDDWFYAIDDNDIDHEEEEEEEVRNEQDKVLDYGYGRHSRYCSRVWVFLY